MTPSLLLSTASPPSSHASTPAPVLRATSDGTEHSPWNAVAHLDDALQQRKRDFFRRLATPARMSSSHVRTSITNPRMVIASEPSSPRGASLAEGTAPLSASALPSPSLLDVRQSASPAPHLEVWREDLYASTRVPPEDGDLREVLTRAKHQAATFFLSNVELSPSFSLTSASQASASLAQSQLSQASSRVEALHRLATLARDLHDVPPEFQEYPLAMLSTLERYALERQQQLAASGSQLEAIVSAGSEEPTEGAESSMLSLPVETSTSRLSPSVDTAPQALSPIIDAVDDVVVATLPALSPDVDPAPADPTSPRSPTSANMSPVSLRRGHTVPPSRGRSRYRPDEPSSPLGDTSRWSVRQLKGVKPSDESFVSLETPMQGPRRGQARREWEAALLGQGVSAPKLELNQRDSGRRYLCASRGGAPFFLSSVIPYDVDAEKHPVRPQTAATNPTAAFFQFPTKAKRLDDRHVSFKYLVDREDENYVATPVGLIGGDPDEDELLVETLKAKKKKKKKKLGQASDSDSDGVLSSGEDEASDDALEALASDARSNDYDPNYLCGIKSVRHRVVLQLPGLRASVVKFVRRKDLKAELNEQFRLRHEDWIQEGMTLSKIRKVRKLILDVVVEQNLEISTGALAVVNFERLVLKRFVNKANRKLTAAVCLLLAYKFNEVKVLSTTKKQRFRKLLRCLSKTFEVKRRDILRCEFGAWVHLDMVLNVAPDKLRPHVTYLFSQLDIRNRRTGNWGTWDVQRARV